MYKAIKKNFLGAKLLYYSILSNSGDASICLYSLNLVKNMQSSAVRLKKKNEKETSVPQCLIRSLMLSLTVNWTFTKCTCIENVKIYFLYSMSFALIPKSTSYCVSRK